MMKAWTVLVGCLLLAPAALASCKPYLSYRYDLQAIECHALSEETILSYWSGADLGNNVIVTWVYEDLARGPHAVLTAKVFSRIQVGICKSKVECKESLGEMEALDGMRRFHWRGTCEDLMRASAIRRKAYSVRPCCDVDPPESVGCALWLEELVERPVWLEGLDD